MFVDRDVLFAANGPSYVNITQNTGQDEKMKKLRQRINDNEDFLHDQIELLQNANQQIKQESFE